MPPDIHKTGTQPITVSSDHPNPPPRLATLGRGGDFLRSWHSLAFMQSWTTSEARGYGKAIY